MRQLSFPTDEIVGTLDWLGARDLGGRPILATGVVEVPDDVEISLSVTWIESIERHSGGGYAITPVRSSHGSQRSCGQRSPLHLGFLRGLPRDGITNLQMVRTTVVPESLSNLPHLAPGLRRLYLGWSDLGNEVLEYVARLDNLVYLQTWGNRFTDDGMRQLASLQALEELYLEEESLSPDAFAVVTSLPHLTRVGAAEEWSDENRSELRSRFPSLVR